MENMMHKCKKSSKSIKGGIQGGLTNFPLAADSKHPRSLGVGRVGCKIWPCKYLASHTQQEPTQTAESHDMLQLPTFASTQIYASLRRFYEGYI